MTVAERLLYALGQSARVGWYTGHYYLSRRLAPPSPKRAKPAKPTSPTPARRELTMAMAELLRTDLANIEAGYYALPPGMIDHPLKMLRASLAYWRDLPAVNRRRAAGRRREVAADDRFKLLPDYYRQNFHYQSGGYLTQESAELYDTQVEILFNGTADAMRRQALVPIARYLRGRRSDRAALLDMACGTGRLIGMVKDNWPRLRVTGLDLSAAYLAVARRDIGRRARLGFIQGPAEAVPLEDASQDLVSCVFLLHELPKSVRAQVAAEIARLLKPGGRLVVVDSLQLGDRPGWDGLLDMFPTGFHEPYFADYVRTDLAQLFAAAGLLWRGDKLAFLSKVSVFERDG